MDEPEFKSRIRKVEDSDQYYFFLVEKEGHNYFFYYKPEERAELFGALLTYAKNTEYNLDIRDAFYSMIKVTKYHREEGTS